MAGSDIPTYQTSLSQRFSLQQKVAIGFVVSFAIFSLIGVSLITNLYGANASNEWSGHSYQIINHIERFDSALKESRASKNAFLAHGNQRDLNVMEWANQAALSEFKILKDLTRDNPQQLARLDSIYAVLDKRMGILERIATIYQKTGRVDEEVKALNAQMIPLVDNLNRQISQFQATERELLNKRLQGGREQAQTSFVLAMIGGCLITMIMLVLYSLINRELTDRDKLQKYLMEAKNQAQLTSKMKSEFLANMSHEIRTPMNGILGMAEILKNTVLDLEQRRYVQMIDASGQTLLMIINDILDFSKIEAGKFNLEPVKFKLRETVCEALYPFSKLTADKGIELLFHIQSDVPNHIIGDSQRFRQILNNLVGNAVKFTEEGEIYIGVELEQKPEYGSTYNPSDNRVLRLHGWVKDSGIGISPEKQKMIFEPFTQADGSTSRRFGGTGLGLSICRQLIRLMNGQIWLESKEGIGSTFHFVIELEANDSPSPTLIPASLQDLGQLNVLVVDDNATSREIFKEFLKEWNFIPTEAENGAVALAMMRDAVQQEKPYDMVLLDVGMPNMDGFTVVEHMKLDDTLSNMKIVILTSYGHVGDISKCQALDIDGYLTKPISQQSLLNCILSIFSNSFDFQPVQDLHMSAESTRHKQLVTAQSMQGNQFQMRFLVVEDNEINQAVAVKMLHEEGHWVDVAANGKEAVDLFVKNPYDVILMDIHMPEMDGFEATSHIRDIESQFKPKIPIIALTANAVKGDKEVCLAAGMDAYISKPFKKQDLIDALQMVMSSHTKSESNNIDSSEADMKQTLMPMAIEEPKNEAEFESAANMLDKESILSRVDNDLTFLSRLILMFNQAIPAHLENIETAIQMEDAHLLEEQAHALKGAISNFTDKKPFEVAKAMEFCGKSKDFSSAPKTLMQLKSEIQILQEELQYLL